jgi:hypothetical protein
MRVRMLTAMAGPRFCYQCGQEVDLPDGEARRYVAARIAELVTGDGAQWELPIAPADYLQRFGPDAPNYGRAAALMASR